MVTNSEDAKQLSNYMKENFVETDEEKAARIKQVWLEVVISFGGVATKVFCNKNQLACKWKVIRMCNLYP